MPLHMKARQRIWRQQAIDAIPFLWPAWRAAATGSNILAATGRFDALSAQIAAQVHRTSRDEGARKMVDASVQSYPWSKSDAPRVWQPKYIPERLLVVKPFVSSGEKGVLRVMFSEMIRALPDIPGFDALAERYHFVFAPSWAGAADPGLLQYARSSEPITVLTNTMADQEFLESYTSALKPLRLPSCAWADPKIAAPYLGREKKYDIVMNASWAPWKRHFALIRAVSEVQRPLKVALIGMPWNGGTRDDILDCARMFGVQDQISIFEQIPFDRVMDILSSSRVAVLMSLKEAANRALAEAVLCDVPVVILDRYAGGFEVFINPGTGRISSERDLASTLTWMLDNAASFSPRAWALEHMACEPSSARLNDFVKKLEMSRSRPWTADMVPASTSPELLYCDSAQQKIFKVENDFVRRCFTHKQPSLQGAAVSG